MAQRTCSVDGCQAAHLARGWCAKHYSRWQKHGDPTQSWLTRAEMFWNKVAVTDGCWEWTAAKNQSGYGRFWDGERCVQAHRWAYEQLVGPIPDALELDHLCRNRGCVRPEHLEPVTGYENILRGEGGSAMNARKTRCWRGHSLGEDGDVYVARDGARSCRECRRIRRAMEKVAS